MSKLYDNSDDIIKDITDYDNTQNYCLCTHESMVPISQVYEISSADGAGCLFNAGGIMVSKSDIKKLLDGDKGILTVVRDEYYFSITVENDEDAPTNDEDSK